MIRWAYIYGVELYKKDFGPDIVGRYVHYACR